MDSEELLELQGLVNDIAAMAPVEALPVEALPVHAIGWLPRLVTLLARHAYLLAFFGAMVENTVFLGFLLPGGAVVALAAAGARAAGLSPLVVIALAAAGMTAGGVVDYWLGRSGAARLLRHRRAGRLGRRLADQLDGAGPMLKRHGWWMMFLAHAFGHGRSSLAVAAGASGLPLRRYVVMEGPAAVVWSAFYAGGGFFLAAEWQTVELVFRRLGWMAAILFLAGAGGWWFWQRRRRRSLAAGSPAGHSAPPQLSEPPAPAGPPAPTEPPAPAGIPATASVQPLAVEAHRLNGASGHHPDAEPALAEPAAGRGTEGA